jgi:hypothetical protein
MVTVPSLWIVTPSPPGWNIVVYLSSAILFMLSNDHLSPGRMSASLAVSVSCLKGSFVLVDVCNLVLWGRYTSLLDFSSDGKFSSLLIKWEVVLEMMIIFIALVVLPCVVSICLFLVLPLLVMILLHLLLLHLIHFHHCCCHREVGPNSLLQPGMCDASLFLFSITPGCLVSVSNLGPTHLHVL